jgi:hypothetical protein
VNGDKFRIYGWLICDVCRQRVPVDWKLYAKDGRTLLTALLISEGPSCWPHSCDVDDESSDTRTTPEVRPVQSTPPKQPAPSS